MRFSATGAALAVALLAAVPAQAQDASWDGTWVGSWNNAVQSTVAFSRGKAVSFTYGGAAQQGFKSTGDGSVVNVEGKGYLLTLARADENTANASYRGPQGVFVAVLTRR